MAYKNIFRSSIIILLIMIFVNPIMGQRWKMRRYEAGFGLGITQIFGDIGGTLEEEDWFGLKDIKFEETSLAFPLYIRYRLDPLYSIKVNAIVGLGHGDDSESKNDRGRSYKVLLNEFSAQMEYYFLAEEKKYSSAAMFNRRGMVNNYMSLAAYGFAGVGGFYSLSRELTVPENYRYPVDDDKGNSLGVVIPFGVGAKIILSDRWVTSAELGYRYSLSDYVEGYTQTASSKFNDVYYFLNFMVAYRLETTRRGLPTLLDKEYRSVKKKSNSAKRRKEHMQKTKAIKKALE